MRRRRNLSLALSLGAHGALLAVLLSSHASAPEPMVFAPDRPPIPVALFKPEQPKPEEAPAPAGPPEPAPAVAPPKLKVHVAAPSPTVPPVVATPAPKPQPMPTLSDAELSGAITAGSGSGGGGGGSGGEGGGCDMVRRLQGALAKDPEVRAAVIRAAAETRGAILVWNGDWIRDPQQEGKGLAGVRQAIALEVAFAPEPCRKQTMRGLVLLTLADDARLALGGGAWRWTDLLVARR